jgi:hypothetical protein
MAWSERMCVNDFFKAPSLLFTCSAALVLRMLEEYDLNMRLHVCDVPWNRSTRIGLRNASALPRWYDLCCV